ncbi:MAG: hypothetical protein JST75_05900 [Bacteroidetes bacterium]|nr:hypothetical protein [Bacteroidota bacterium]
MRKKTKVITLITIAAIVIAGISVWQYYKYKIAHEKINELVNTKTKGLYNIHYENLSFDEVGGTLRVENVKLIPDTAFYRRLKSDQKEPPVLITLDLPSLNISGIKTPKALLNKEISGNKIEIKKPTIEIAIDNFLKDTSGYSPGKDIYKQILGDLKSISMDSIIVTQANLVVKDIRTGKTKFKGTNVSFILSELKIDSLEKDDSSRILFSKNIDALCKEIAIYSEDKNYIYHFENLEFISQVKSFKAGRICIEPTSSEEAFTNHLKFQKDQYDFAFENLVLRDMNLQNLWRKTIEADELFIGKSSFKIYRDIALPHDSISRVGAFPQQQLMRLSIPVNIRKVVFQNSFIQYKEKNAKSDTSGKLQFYHVNAVMTNLTNISSLIKRNNISTLDFHARFLDKAPLSAKLTMYLKNSNGRFDVSGGMGSMHGADLNKMIKPMALAEIEKGDIQKVNFDLHGDNYSAYGKLQILYNDVHLSLLKKNEEKNKYTKKVLPTFVANIVLKNSNPSKPGDEYRVANVHYKRDTIRSFFNLLWKSIFSGVKQSAGMK